MTEISSRPSGSDVAAEMSRLAELAARASSAAGCFVRWSSAEGSGGLAMSADSARWRSVADALLDRIAGRTGGAGGERAAHLSAGEVERLAPVAAAYLPLEAFAARAQSGSVSAAALGLVAAASANEETGTLVQLFAAAAAAVVASNASETSREFWRAQALEARQKEQAASAALALARSELKWLDRSAAAAASLKTSARLAGLGSIAASAGRFDGWIVATLENDGAQVAAVSRGLAPPPPLDDRSALSDSMRRGARIVRADRGGRIAYREDGFFDCGYMCAPFNGGAIALAFGGAIDEQGCARVEALLARLDPLIAAWRAQAENERLRRLTRDLALRAFAAIDAERGRIARDLHDDQAQLLAVARLALAARGAQAREIFGKLENELRARVRSLRPAALGKATLRAALGAEVRRLALAGVAAKLDFGAGAARLPRPVQQVCYQAAREAVSNVIRHSGATRARVSIDRGARRARLVVSDNGRGLPRGAGGAGTGLAGMAERLAMMGGAMRVESRPGATRVVVEIPES